MPQEFTLRPSPYKRTSNVQLDSVFGTWIPEIRFSGTNGDLSVTYQYRYGVYVRRADEVTLQWNLQTSAFTHSTAIGFFELGGLPFKPSAGNVICVGSGMFGGYTLSTHTWLSPFAQGDYEFLQFYASGSGQTPTILTTSHVLSSAIVASAGTVVYNATFAGV